jgi:propanol-preferring alcohol dehydrogenase
MSQANPIVRASMQGSPRRRWNRSNKIDELWAYIRGPLLAFPAYGKRLLQLARIVTVSNMPSAEAPSIPQTQTAALVRELGGKIEFRTDYPVPKPGVNEVLVKVLYTGVCQSDLHTKNGTAASATGDPITKIKFPHVGGHEGVGRIIALGPEAGGLIKAGLLVGIRLLSRVCHECDYCLAGHEQYCVNSTNHLHHEDGSFQEYCVLDAKYLAVLPEDVDPSIQGPVLCAGVTAYNAVQNANIKKGQYMVVLGAGGGLGHFAVQYGLALGAKVIAVDSGDSKKALVESYGVEAFVDFAKTKDVVGDVLALTGIGADAVVVTSGNPKAYAQAADMLRPGGSLNCVGIPPGKTLLQIPVAGIVIKGLRITGGLVGSLKEGMEAMEYVRKGIVKPQVEIRKFRELPQVYEQLEKGDVSGRIVLRIADE